MCPTKFVVTFCILYLTLGFVQEGHCCYKAMKAVVKGRKRMDPKERDAILATSAMPGKKVTEKLANGGIALDSIDVKSLNSEVRRLKVMKHTLKKREKLQADKLKARKEADHKAWKKNFDTKRGP